ncbi:hypothetical protein E1265_12385 [Streptomyces sp. 8K308]|uniref:hypothetical protein n=1 Tax=Streptomyces sp. 8K308 TaxID=2530388 RepID=UPI0010428602|nr:hypothetical protein [Streptomyces sp. 8K308]TDC23585.1 hypothetical protein E1265_12385 [Streptomyces sp. 8K308]
MPEDEVGAEDERGLGSFSMTLVVGLMVQYSVGLESGVPTGAEFARALRRATGDLTGQAVDAPTGEHLPALAAARHRQRGGQGRIRSMGSSNSAGWHVAAGAGVRTARGRAMEAWAW